MSEVLTVSEIAEQLRVTHRTVRNWIEKGILPGLKVGNTYRVTRENFDNFLKESETKKLTD